MQNRQVTKTGQPPVKSSTNSLLKPPPPGPPRASVNLDVAKLSAKTNRMHHFYGQTASLPITAKLYVDLEWDESPLHLQTWDGGYSPLQDGHIQIGYCYRGPLYLKTRGLTFELKQGMYFVTSERGVIEGGQGFFCCYRAADCALFIGEILPPALVKSAKSQICRTYYPGGSSPCGPFISVIDVTKSGTREPYMAEAPAIAIVAEGHGVCACHGKKFALIPGFVFTVSSDDCFEFESGEPLRIIFLHANRNPQSFRATEVPDKSL